MLPVHISVQDFCVFCAEILSQQFLSLVGMEQLCAALKDTVQRDFRPLVFFFFHISNLP